MRSFPGSKLAGIAALGTMLFCGLARPALAASYDAQPESLAIRLSPAIIEDEASPGESIRTELTITNLSDQLLPVQAKVANIGSRNARGDIQVLEAQPAGSAKDWLMFETETILDPGKSKSIPIRVNVPKSATPGTHPVGIFFRPFLPGTGASDLRIQSELAALMFITVKGDLVASASIERVRLPIVSLAAPIPIDVRYANTGNVYLKPSTTITLRSLGGQPVDVFNPDSQGSLAVLPGSAREQTYRWKTALLPGIYRADVAIAAAGTESTARRWVLVVPYPLLILFLPPLFWFAIVRGRAPIGRLLRRLRAVRAGKR